MFAVRELYLDLLDMMCNIRSFAISLLEDDEIDSRPACYMHEPHMRGLDFLTNDLHIMLNVLLECLKNKELDTDEKLDTLFHFALFYSILSILYVTFNLYSDPNALEQLQCVAHHENPLEIGTYL